MTLPDPPRALGAYRTSVRHGDLLFLSGMLPVAGGEPGWTGRVGRELTVDEGRQAARLAARNGLAVAADVMGGLDRVRRVVRLAVHVACDPAFTDLARVADGGSEALLEALGPRGEHARLAFGAVALPKGVPVELELILAVDWRTAGPPKD
jgi:enamine deaminase RidA (YjgF/YER057c/UK114 family)